MSGPQRLIDSTMKLVWTLLLCAVLFSALRQWALCERVAVGQRTQAATPWIALVLQVSCAFLFLIGTVVRIQRWFSIRTAEAVRRQRLDSAHTFVGAPERIGTRRSSALELPRPRRKAARGPGGRR